MYYKYIRHAQSSQIVQVYFFRIFIISLKYYRPKLRTKCLEVGFFSREFNSNYNCILQTFSSQICCFIQHDQPFTMRIYCSPGVRHESFLIRESITTFARLKTIVGLISTDLTRTRWTCFLRLRLKPSPDRRNLR